MPKVGLLATIALGKPIPPPPPAPSRPHRRLPPYTSPRSSHYRPLPPIEGTIHSLYSPTPFTADAITLDNKLKSLQKQKRAKRNSAYPQPKPPIIIDLDPIIDPIIIDLDPEPTTQPTETIEQQQPKIQPDSVLRKRPRQHSSVGLETASEASTNIENIRPSTKKPRVQGLQGAQYDSSLLELESTKVPSQTPQLKKAQTEEWGNQFRAVNRFDSSSRTPAQVHGEKPAAGMVRDIDEISSTPIAPPNYLLRPHLGARLGPHNATLHAARETRLQASVPITEEVGINERWVAVGKMSVPHIDPQLGYGGAVHGNCVGRMHPTEEPIHPAGHTITEGAYPTKHPYSTQHNYPTGQRPFYATESLAQAIEQQQSMEKVYLQSTATTAPTQRGRRRERKEPVKKRVAIENRKRERAATMETDVEFEDYPAYQSANPTAPTPYQPRQVVPTSERLYARQYPLRKIDPVVESMLPKFTMPPKTAKPENLLLQAKEKQKAGRAEIYTTRENGVELSEQHLDIGGISARASRAASRLNRQTASIPLTNNDSNKSQPPSHEAVTDHYPAQLSHVESVESSSSAQEESEDDIRELSLSPDHERSESINTILEPRPSFSEEYLEPYKSSFFFPQLDDDYGPPKPVVYWHMENQMHPEIPDRAAPRVGLINGLVDLSSQQTKTTTPINFEGLDPELAELLKPMTDDEDDTEDGVGSDEESSDGTAEAPFGLVKFPLDAPMQNVKEYAALKQALKEGLGQRNQIYEKHGSRFEGMKKRVKQQEQFEKKEKWGERRLPTRPTGTKSRAMAVVVDTHPDFLDWLRSKVREE